jgi:NADH-quinone oxidoreductase subunit C
MAETDVAAEQAAAPEPGPPVALMFGVPVTESIAGQTVLHPSRSELLGVIGELREAGYWQCLDICGVDYLTHPDRSDLPLEVHAERFEVVVVLMNHTERCRIRLRVQIPESDPSCPSLFAIHPGSEAPERETFDLFGIVFDGHPDMTRILLPDGWEGHPLRKDYAIGQIPVQFKAAGSGR